MYLPRLRFTVRWLLVAVLVVSIIFGIYVMVQRRAKYLQMAKEWKYIATEAKNDLEGHGIGSDLGVAPEVSRTLYIYYDSLRKKYEYAADHPWLSIKPDPPNPLPAPPPPPL